MGRGKEARQIDWYAKRLSLMVCGRLHGVPPRCICCEIVEQSQGLEYGSPRACDLAVRAATYAYAVLDEGEKLLLRGFVAPSDRMYEHGVDLNTLSAVLSGASQDDINLISCWLV